MQALVRHQLDSRAAAAINWTIERRVCHCAEIKLGTVLMCEVRKSEVHVQGDGKERLVIHSANHIRNLQPRTASNDDNN